MTSISLAGSTALVTGGAGFVGSHIVDALVDEGARVRVVDNFVRGGQSNLTAAQRRGRVELISGDIRDPSLWGKCLPGVDVVFHQAALRVNRCEENPRECWDVMVQATFELLSACAEHNIRKIVAASSAIVYGKADALPTPETEPLRNATWYGAAKIANEQMLNALYAQKKIPGIALRYFNIYGPRMATQGHTEVLVKWLQALDAGQPLRIFGDGAQTMDWVHVTDIARANLLAAQSPHDQGVFNIASGQETSLLELGRLLLRVMQKPGEPELVRSQAPANPIPRRWADIGSARQALGYEPRVGLEKGLLSMKEWWLTHAQMA